MARTKGSKMAKPSKAELYEKVKELEKKLAHAEANLACYKGGHKNKAKDGCDLESGHSYDEECALHPDSDENIKLCCVPSCNAPLKKDESGICSECDRVASHPSVTKPWFGR